MNEVADYVQRVDKALRGLPKSGREEIVAEIGEHARAAVAELDNPTASDIRNALDRIGEPEDIAAEARERFGVETATPTWREPTAVVLLLFGWLLPILGTLAGLVLLWMSKVWSTGQKAAGSVMAFGVPLALFLTATARETKCYSQVDGGPRLEMPCSDRVGGLGGFELVVLLVWIVAIVAVLASLIRSLRRARLAVQ